MDYRDVTHDYFKSRRTTNPLQPTYNCRIEEGKDPVEIGKIEKILRIIYFHYAKTLFLETYH